MNRKLMSVMFVVAAMLVCGQQAAQATIWDAYDQFNGASNTADDRWQYLQASPGSNDYQLLPTDGAGGWAASGSGTLPSVYKDTTNGEIRVHPGPVGTGSCAVLGWKSPITGTADISFSVTDRDNSAGSGVDYYLLRGAIDLGSGWVPNGSAYGPITVENQPVSEGDMLYLQISPGGDNHWADLTGVTFTISSVPEPSTLVLLSTGLIGLLAYAWRKRK